MTQKMLNPGGEAGALDCHAGQPDRPEYNRPNIEAPPPPGPGADECLYRLRRALRKGRIARDSWAFDFTRSLLRHDKRRGWIPSPKQLYAMRRLVAELAEPDAGPLIDDGGDDAAA